MSLAAELLYGTPRGVVCPFWEYGGAEWEDCEMESWGGGWGLRMSDGRVGMAFGFFTSVEWRGGVNSPVLQMQLVILDLVQMLLEMVSWVMWSS